MNQAVAEINAGICGNHTTAVASTEDGRATVFQVETTCENVRRMSELIAEQSPVDAYREINPRAESVILACGRQGGCCTDCIVPASLIKVLRVATNLALPADVAISLARKE